MTHLFDFTNLRSEKIRGCTVVQADKVCFQLSHNRTGKVFTIICKSASEFDLYARTPGLKETDYYGSFIARADLKRVLYFVGVLGESFTQ